MSVEKKFEFQDIDLTGSQPVVRFWASSMESYAFLSLEDCDKLATEAATLVEALLKLRKLK